MGFTEILGNNGVAIIPLEMVDPPKVLGGNITIDFDEDEHEKGYKKATLVELGV